MKKLFTLFAALVAALAINATTVTLNFSDATAFGYANPANGEFTQVNSGDVIEKDGVSIAVSFSSGNGLRFFAHTNTGVINLRGYVGASFTISVPAGQFIHSIAIDGTNLNSTYLAGDIVSDSWSGEAVTVSANINKSTVQMNTMTVVFGEQGEQGAAGPDTIVKTIPEIIAMQAAEVNTTDFFQTTGVVGQILNSTYGNFGLFEGNDSILVYGTLDAAGATKNFASLGINEGDTITVLGKMKVFNGTLEFVNVTVLNQAGGNGGQGGDQGTFDPSIAHTIAEIKAAQAAGLVKDDDEIIIKGFIKSMFLKPNNFTRFGSVTIWLTSSVDGEEKEFELYNCYGLNGDTLASYVPVADAELGDGSKNIDVESVTGNNGIMFSLGDEVVAKGAFKLYNTTYELNTGCYIIEGGMKTALRQEKAAVKTVKFVENGQLVIIKDGVRFNALGARF